MAPDLSTSGSFQDRAIKWARGALWQIELQARGVTDAVVYDRRMPQYRKVTEERIVTREQFKQGYFERDGFSVKKRPYELIRELPDGRYLVRAPEPPKQ